MTDVTVVMTTYLPAGLAGAEQRREVQRLALESWRTRLGYSDGAIHLHIADDGSENFPGEFLWAIDAWDRGMVTTSQQARHGVGASLNRGCVAAFGQQNIVGMFVDDWVLTYDLDITPWIDLLQRDPGVCMVRFFPHPDLTGRVEHLGDLGHALRLDRHHFAFATRPALYHPRMFEAYGRFTEDVNAYDAERIYNERFCAMSGPDIMLALPTPWLPLDSIELADVEPREG